MVLQCHGCNPLPGQSGDLPSFVLTLGLSWCCLPQSPAFPCCLGRASRCWSQPAVPAVRWAACDTGGGELQFSTLWFQVASTNLAFPKHDPAQTAHITFECSVPRQQEIFLLALRAASLQVLGYCSSSGSTCHLRWQLRLRAAAAAAGGPLCRTAQQTCQTPQRGCLCWPRGRRGSG